MSFFEDKGVFPVAFDGEVTLTASIHDLNGFELTDVAGDHVIEDVVCEPLLPQCIQTVAVLGEPESEGLMDHPDPAFSCSCEIK